MFQVSKRMSLTLVFLMFLVSFPCVASAALSEDVAAMVGGIPVTRFEVRREVQKILPMQVSFHGGVSPEKIAEVENEALERLIERAYKVRYALGEELAVDNAAVEKAYQEVRKRFKTDADFRKALAGEAPAAYRASLYRELLAKRAEEIAVESRVKVGEEEVEAYYKENKARFMRPRQFKASHILVRVDPASNAEEREKLQAKAEQLSRQARDGEDFYNLAYYNSDDRTKFVGGDLGYFHMGQTVKEFEEALLKLKPGEVSGPVKTLHGWHVIKLVEDNPARQLALEDVRDKVRAAMEKERRDTLYKEWMEALQGKYPVERQGK